METTVTLNFTTSADDTAVSYLALLTLDGSTSPPVERALATAASGGRLTATLELTTLTSGQYTAQASAAGQQDCAHSARWGTPQGITQPISPRPPPLPGGREECQRRQGRPLPCL